MDNRIWVGDRNENLLGEIEVAQIGITVNEFGREQGVLVEAMEDEPGMYLLKKLWFGAEV